MRVLGLDYGTKRVGVAISDGSRLIASPYLVLDRKTATTQIAEIVGSEEVELVVVGLPVSLSGGEGVSAERAREFAQEVESETGLEVVLFDERFTTNTADAALLESGMRRRERRETVDKVAAAVILQSYLDSR